MNQWDSLLSTYNLKTETDYADALREIMQEIALLGLWRARFFDKAAFYGGTALRLFYGLNRYSEDLDFSLLKEDRAFTLKQYFSAIKSELESLGFEVDIVEGNMGAIESAFIKTNTLHSHLVLGAPKYITDKLHAKQLIKIKFEIDINPPQKFKTEIKQILTPIPFTARVYDISSLFSGKLHAILCRAWKTRIKGRDWFDLVWFLGKKHQ